MRTPDASSTLNGLATAWWHHVLTALHTPHTSVWPAIVAGLLTLGMLLSFQQVVARSVAQGELRRTAARMQLEGAWRCKLLRDASDRAGCLAQSEIEPLPASRQARASDVSKTMEK